VALDRSALSRLFFLSLALSAWKQVVSPEGDVLSRWPLRVNPSSGNLHPTEGYLVCGPVDGITDTAGVFHYAPDGHLLERRASLPDYSWRQVASQLPPHSFLIGLSSIHWREAWKYGERAFRYCQHDVGHALAAVDLAAACLGWQTTLLHDVPHGTVGTLLGTALQRGPEKEHADGLVLVSHAGADGSKPGLAAALEKAGRLAVFAGAPNTLSSSHVDWPVIDEAAAACAGASVAVPPADPGPPPDAAAESDRGLPAATIIRQRRSAVRMDGQTELDRAAFRRILRRLLPGATRRPFASLDFAPQVSLVLFVHRVQGLEPGLYALVRHPDHEESLRRGFRSEFAWSRPAGWPDDLPLYQLAAGDTRDAARQLSCGQDIAADGAFSVGMLARFRDALRQHGAGFYRHLFWETGMIGQMLYLEAEAAGVRGTGIGCFFDDEVHRALGLTDDTWQSLYHFTVGGAVDDTRLQTQDAYAHLDS
jgi:SagB-type dehydrogenase family enzyme